MLKMGIMKRFTDPALALTARTTQLKAPSKSVFSRMGI